jgi:hypothetical protein
VSTTELRPVEDIEIPLTPDKVEILRAGAMHPPLRYRELLEEIGASEYAASANFFRFAFLCSIRLITGDDAPMIVR